MAFADGSVAGVDIDAALVSTRAGAGALADVVDCTVRRRGGGETVLVCALKGVGVSRSSRFLFRRARRSASIALRSRLRRVVAVDGAALNSTPALNE